MTLTLMEGAVDALKDYLETNMSGKLDELDIEYGDLPLSDVLAYYVAELSEVPEQPAVLILGDRTDIEREGEDYIKGAYTITIAFLVTDQDPENLRRRLYRYIRACFELLKAARSSSGWAYVINFRGADFSPMFTRGSTFLADARLVVELRKIETQ